MQFSLAIALVTAMKVGSASPYPHARIEPSTPGGCSLNHRKPFGLEVQPLPSAFSKAATTSKQIVTKLTYTMAPLMRVRHGKSPAPTSKNSTPVSANDQGSTPLATSCPLQVIQMDNGQVEAPATAPALAKTEIEHRKFQSLIELRAIVTLVLASLTNRARFTPKSSHNHPSVPLSRSSSPEHIPSTLSSSCSIKNRLELTLDHGIIIDGQGRTGYIASNYQFQFDDIPQSGALYTAGFSGCRNDTLALGGSSVWFKCPSGEFYKLYSRKWASHCEAVSLAMVDLVRD